MAGSAFGDNGRAQAVAPATVMVAQPPGAATKRTPRNTAEWRAQVEQALRAHGGNAAAAGRALGVGRNEICRAIEKFGIVVQRGGDAPDAVEE